jgi:tetratricopeptide (TPR) repeat protein
MNAIGSTLKSMGYVYDDKHVDYYHSCLRNKAMDCDIFACTYVTVADKFGLPVNLVYGPGHAFVKWNSTDVNFYWECTNHSETSFSDYKNWLLFKEYQVSSGAFMRPMDRQEQIGHAYFLLASNAYYDEAINYLLTAISLSEKNIFAYLFIAHKFSKDEKYPYLEKATNLLQSDFFLASELADYYEYSDYSKSILFYLKSIDEFENYMSSYGKNEYKVKYYNNIYSLYYLFKKTNDTKNAIEWGERYIRENPSNEYRIESIKKDIYELKNPKK